MILKNFDANNIYSNYKEGTINSVLTYTGEFEGYYQNHVLGLIIFSSLTDCLIIDGQKYNLTQIGIITYTSSGTQRKVTIG